MMGSVTSFLNAVQPDDSQSADHLLPLVYRELRVLASSRLRREAPGQTLQTTALVHEAYLRLIGAGPGLVGWKNRAQFFAAASEAMRRIVIDNCRRRKRMKHGGGFGRVEMDLDSIACQQLPHDLLAINEALEALEAVDPQKALLVKLRYFAGMTMAQVAGVLEISLPTAERHWRYTRAWIADFMRNQN